MSIHADQKHCTNPECNETNPQSINNFHKNEAQNYHHHSYKKEHWLDVIPLCEICHKGLHPNEL